MSMMIIRIIGTESLGIRGLSCVVEAGDKKYFIDPGMALGYQRHGLMPHPVQVGVGRIIGKRILNELKDTTDVIISHFHGDHIPLSDANPYQLSLDRVKEIPFPYRIWANSCNDPNGKMKKREDELLVGLNKNLNKALGKIDESLFFFDPVPHGEDNPNTGKVTMTRITHDDLVFVHASDIQFLSEDTITNILESKPDMVFASGPPVYLEDFMRGRYTSAKQNSLKLAEGVKTLILDHHMLRCDEGLAWLDELSAKSGNSVICAADFMGFNRHLLEAWRPKLYEDIPVPGDWHSLYAENKADTEEYLEKARKKYKWFSY